MEKEPEMNKSRSSRNGLLRGNQEGERSFKKEENGGKKHGGGDRKKKID